MKDIKKKKTRIVTVAKAKTRANRLFCYGEKKKRKIKQMVKNWQPSDSLVVVLVLVLVLHQTSASIMTFRSRV